MASTMESAVSIEEALVIMFDIVRGNVQELLNRVNHHELIHI